GVRVSPGVERAGASCPWFRYRGPGFGREKVVLLRLSRVFVMPGLVGLAILDCAAVGLPIVTTAYPYHSPEIAYLEPGQNGLIVEDWQNIAAYAEAAISVLRDSNLRQTLAAGATATGVQFSSERMAKNFSEVMVAPFRAPNL